MWIPTPRPRSVFWVVATHVVTSLVWTISLIFGMSCVLIAVGYSAGSSWQGVLVAVVAAIVAALVATEHSAHFIRTRAILPNPRVCIVPSCIVFGGCMAGLITLPFLMFRRASVPLRLEDVAGIVGYFVGTVASFSWLTWFRFSSMEATDLRGFEVQTPQPVEPLAPQEPRPPPAEGSE